jgi:hypothetical protein
MMTNRTFRWVAQIGAIVVATSLGAAAQTAGPTRFSGLIGDYTPATNPATIAGPWVVRGEWSVLVKGDSGKADFSAVLTMVRSDLGVTDLNSPAARNAHTHHVTLTDGTVSALVNGFEVTGIGTVTANGNPPPFGQSIPLTIDVTGGTLVTYSNVKLRFGGAAVGHFGAQPLNGVVRSIN